MILRVLIINGRLNRLFTTCAHIMTHFFMKFYKCKCFVPFTRTIKLRVSLHIYFRSNRSIDQKREKKAKMIHKNQYENTVCNVNAYIDTHYHLVDTF